MAHTVSERDQKSYLLEAVHKTVTERLLVEGIKNSSIDHLLSLVKISLLGPHWERLVLDEWQGVRMVENESVFRFHQRVQMFNNALSCQPMSVERDRILIYSELRLKFPVVMREMLEEEQPLFRCGKSWGDFWEDLEKLEHSLAYKDRVLMHKQVEVQGGFKNLKPPKKKGSETKESGRGGAVGGGGKGGGGKLGGQTGGSAGKNCCYRCGSGEHWSNSCDHPIASKIPLKADGCLLIICYNCFEAGHSRSKCPKKKADSGEGQSGGRGFFAGRRGLEEEVWWAEEREPQEVVSWGEMTNNKGFLSDSLVILPFPILPTR